MSKRHNIIPQCLPVGRWQVLETQRTDIQYIPRNMHTVFALLCFVVVIHWLIFPYPSGLLHWHCARKATLMNMDKYFMWIHYERLHNHNKAKHNKTVCIFLGIYCKITSYWWPQVTTGTAECTMKWHLHCVLITLWQPVLKLWWADYECRQVSKYPKHVWFSVAEPWSFVFLHMSIQYIVNP